MRSGVRWDGCRTIHFPVDHLGMILAPKNDNADKLPTTGETPLTLIRKIQAGNLSAFLALYDSTSPLLFGWITRILKDRTSAEGTLLDVYTQVWKDASSYEPGTEPLLWLSRLAHTSALARLHLGKHEAAGQSSPRDKGNPDMTVAPDLQLRARSSLESVPAAQRGLLEQAYFGGLCSNEMAAQVGKPVGAVKALLRTGLSRIGESFGTGAED